MQCSPSQSHITVHPLHERAWCDAASHAHICASSNNCASLCIRGPGVTLRMHTHECCRKIVHPYATAGLECTPTPSLPTEGVHIHITACLQQLRESCMVQSLWVLLLLLPHDLNLMQGALECRSSSAATAKRRGQLVQANWTRHQPSVRYCSSDYMYASLQSAL